jgi:hypothetical protein
MDAWITTCVSHGTKSPPTVVWHQSCPCRHQLRDLSMSEHSHSFVLLLHHPSTIMTSTTRMPPHPVPTSSAPLPSDEIFLPSNPEAPAQILTVESHVSEWPPTPGYRAFIGWLKQRCEQIRGRTIIEGNEGASVPIASLLGLLDNMISWVDEVPPQPQKAQRFGNLAFRKYIALVEEVCDRRGRPSLTVATPRYRG